MKWRHLLSVAPALLAAPLAVHAADSDPAKATIKSHFSTEYKPMPARLLVLTNLGTEFSAEEAGKLRDLMAAKLNACGISAQFGAAPPYSADASTAVAYNAGMDAVLKLQLVSDATPNGSSWYRGTFTVVPTGRAVWHADINVTPGYNVAQAYKDVVINQLAADGMLPMNCSRAGS